MLFCNPDSIFVLEYQKNLIRGYENSKGKLKKGINIYRKNKNISDFSMDHSYKKEKSFSDGIYLRKDKRFKNLNQKKIPFSENTGKYFPLHTHSDLSLLDGASRVSEMVLFTKELKIKSLSITDHGVMHAIVDLFKECGAPCIGASCDCGGDVSADHVELAAAKEEEGDAACGACCATKAKKKTVSAAALRPRPSEQTFAH